MQSAKASRERAVLDTDFEIPAPEFILFRYPVAGPVSRLMAVLIDHALIIGLTFLIFLILFIVFSISALAALEALSGLVWFLLFFSLFLLNWFYFLFFEWFNRGRTPGKLAMGLRVVSVDGTSLSFMQLLVRNLVRPADMFPMSVVMFPTYLVGGAAAFFRGRSFQRLGDLAAGTIVVREQRPELQLVAPTAGQERISELSRAMNIRVYPSAALTQGLNDFAANHHRLNPARAHEIAAAVEEPVRRYFGARGLECAPVELLLAAHDVLYRIDRTELSSSVSLRQMNASGEGVRNS